MDRAGLTGELDTAQIQTRTRGGAKRQRDSVKFAGLDDNSTRVRVCGFLCKPRCIGNSLDDQQKNAASKVRGDDCNKSQGQCNR